MNKQLIDIKGILELVNKGRKKKLVTYALANLMYKDYKFSEDYCRYRLSQLANGKKHMYISDLTALQKATGLDVNTILSFITIQKQTTKK